MLEKPINLLQDVQEHRFGEPSRLRVLLAGMVGREEIRKACREFGHGAVRERVCRPECNPAASLQNVEITVPGNLSKSQYGAWLEQLELALKVRTAAHNFFRQGVVVRRGAAAGSAKVSVVKRQAVIAADGSRLAGKAGAVQQAVEKISGTGAGKHAPGAVGSVSCGRQGNDEELRARIAKSGDGTSPVRPLADGPALFARCEFAIFHQPWALAAGNNFVVQYAKRRRRLHGRAAPFRNCASATAWLCSSSFAPKSSVTVPCSFSRCFTC